MDLTCLPFRLINTHILTSVILKTKDICKNKYALYGYYKNDRSRTLFLIFSSIIITENIDLCVDLEKVFYLEIKRPKRKFIELLDSKAHEMKTLSRLHFRQVWNEIWYDRILHLLFQNENSFPSLTHLEVSVFLYSHRRRPTGIEDSELVLPWKKSNIWGKLKTLRLERIPKESQITEIFKESVRWNNLENLSLSYLRRTSDRPIHFHLPTLKRISCFEGISDIFIHAEKLVRFQATVSRKTVKTIEFIFLNSPRLRHLKLKWWDHGKVEPDFYNWLKCEKFQNLQTIELLDIRWDSKGFKFSEKIEKLCVGSIHIGFVEHNYPNLRELDIGPCHGHDPDFTYANTRVFSSFENVLRKFTFDSISREDGEKIFQKHNFQQLEYISLKSTSVIRGESWNPMPKLKEMVFFRVYNLRNSIFEESHIKFPKLESLTIRDASKEVSGKNWDSKFTNRLRKFHYQSMVIEDAQFSLEIFLKENTFGSLEDLYFNCNYGTATVVHDNCENKEWKALSNGVIKNLAFYGVQLDLDSAIFRHPKIANSLQTVKLMVCIETKGKDWVFLPNLQRLWVTDMNNFDYGKFHDSPPFPKSCKFKDRL